jgi:hypothetical protein
MLALQLRSSSYVVIGLYNLATSNDNVCKVQCDSAANVRLTLCT